MKLFPNALSLAYISCSLENDMQQVVGHALNFAYYVARWCAGVPPTSRRLFGGWFLRFIDQYFLVGLVPDALGVVGDWGCGGALGVFAGVGPVAE